MNPVRSRPAENTPARPGGGATIAPARSASNGVDLIGRRKIWYLISASVLAVCVIALALFRLKLGIDFTGGAVMEVEGTAAREQIEAVARENELDNFSINSSGANKLLLRYRLPEQAPEIQQQFEAQLKAQGLNVVRFDQIGPSVSRDLVKNAFAALAVMSLAIVGYITWAFRKVPKSVSALNFGLATLAAAFLHDALFVLGAFAILGKLFGVEVDTFIVTALLTVIGFSIHDTIVVFDRIREKLKMAGGDFVKTVNDSVNETLVRSLNTSLVIVLVLLALFLFGGVSTRYFILALLLGMVSGTYSSIFIASPLLVTWQLRRERAPAAAHK